jgi:tetratricopeptide (TPR) repeat protein
MNDKLIEEYNTRLKENPNSLIFLPLAEIYKKNGMIEEAINTCKKGLSIHPDFYKARLFLAKIYFENNMFEEAYEEFKKLIEMNPNDNTVKELYNAVKQKIAKEKEVTEEIITPTLAELYYQQGFIDDAINMYRKLKEKQPENEEIEKRLKELEEKKASSSNEEIISSLKRIVNELNEIIAKLSSP